MCVSPGIFFHLTVGQNNRRKDAIILGRQLSELSQLEMQEIIQEMLDRKEGNNDKNWIQLTKDYDLDCSSEVLRKLYAGVRFASKAGMKFDYGDQIHVDKDFVERQKLYDIQRKIRQDMREFSRTELICEHISKSIKSLPKIVMENKVVVSNKKEDVERDLVLGIADFHFGADFEVLGLYNDIINKYDSSVFEQRMDQLSDEVTDIIKKEEPDQLTVLIAGDMLDGLLRTSQLQRLEFGVVDSAIKLAEMLTYWFIVLERKINIPIRVYAVRGNHGEIRPLGTKAGQFPEENMERIIMHYLHARFENEKWILIGTNDAPMIQVVDVCGYQILLTHGQDMNIESMAKNCVNLYNQPIDMFMVGHLHKNQTFNSGIMPESNIYVERIPSICGIDPYAQSKGYGAHPGATAILIEEGYGRRCIYPIILK